MYGTMMIVMVMYEMYQRISCVANTPTSISGLKHSLGKTSRTRYVEATHMVVDDGATAQQTLCWLTPRHDDLVGGVLV